MWNWWEFDIFTFVFENRNNWTLSCHSPFIQITSYPSKQKEESVNKRHNEIKGERVTGMFHNSKSDETVKRVCAWIVEILKSKWHVILSYKTKTVWTVQTLAQTVHFDVSKTVLILQLHFDKEGRRKLIMQRSYNINLTLGILWRFSQSPLIWLINLSRSSQSKECLTANLTFPPFFHWLRS